ncbi:hypothetical protein Pmani_011486 [Petrolisthes manimaculis]|uniref:Uncharacterized protein n=1 Tax=Petrolisthes manimaculis TaxID=1843537 RepID=A0AAE1PZH2_9EUCA|nr:hypothetical protein Pmani_011486 [Petrolisthes manimaculis]
MEVGARVMLEWVMEVGCWSVGDKGVSGGEWVGGAVVEYSYSLTKAERAIDLVAATLTGWLAVDHLRAEKGTGNAIYLLVNVAYKEWNIFVMI